MVKSEILSSDIILYWDYYDKKDKNEIYYVYLNKKLVKTTDKTHVTLRNIENRKADIEIYTDELKEELFYKGSYILPDKKEMIDVTLPPYNAIGDGKVMNTKALQGAIDACGSNQCVYVPKGTYLTGALTLHSDMELYIDEDAVLLGSESYMDYLPKIWSRFEGLEMECYSSLINIGNIDNRDEISSKNILIHGGGEIRGGGRSLADNVISVERENLKEYIKSIGGEISSYENENTIPGRLRPKLINISCAQNVLIDNIRISNGSCWNVHMIYSDSIITANCSFYSHGVWNGDGWDPDSSTNCSIFGCDFNTGDDCIAVKSGKNPEGNIIAKPCRNINIFDCRCQDGHGVAIGSEMSGGISDVHIWDCDFSLARFGCHIKATKKRGGYIKNIFVNNTLISRMQIHSVGYNDDGIAAADVPQFSDFYFEDVTISGTTRKNGCDEIIDCETIELIGFDKTHKLKNINFKNIIIDANKPERIHSLSMKLLENISFSNLTVR